MNHQTLNKREVFTVVDPIFVSQKIHSLKLTALPMKLDGWKTILAFLGFGSFSGELLNFRWVN